MKKIILIVGIMFAIVATTTEVFAQQYSVRRIVRAQFTAGTLSVPSTVICPSMPSQTITGTPATGGQPTPVNTYQWQISTSMSPAWVNIITGTGTNLTTGSLAAGTYNYRRIDNNPGCGSIDTTNIISIQVWDPFLAGTATGGGNFCDGDPGTPTTCTPATGGDPTTITQIVQTSPTGLTGTWTATANTTLTYTPAGPMTDNIYVRWEFTGNCGIVYSNPILYNVYDPFIAGVVSNPTVTPACNGTDFGTVTSTAPTGGAPGTTVEWETSIDGLIWTNTGDVDLAYAGGNVTVDTWIRCRYTNSCSTLYSNELFFDVYEPLSSGGIPTLVGNDTICLNTDPGFIDAPSATGGTGVYTYLWYEKIGGGTWNTTGITTEDYDIPALTTPGIHQYQRVTGNVCGSDISAAVAVLVYTEFNPGIIGSHDEPCSGEAQGAIVELTPATGGSGVYSYQWISSDDDEATWNTILGANGTSYTPPAIINATLSDEYYYYRRNVTDSLCGTLPSTAPALPTP